MYDYMALLRIAGSDAQLDAARKMILEFKDKIPGVVYVTVGVNVLTGQEHNWGVYIRFKDVAAREAYRTDPYHQELGRRFGRLVEGQAHFVEFEVS